MTRWDTAALVAADKARLWHPFTQMQDWCAPGHDPLVIVRGKGEWLFDSEGRSYIDGNSSIWTNIHGHSHPRINEAIRRQLDLISHSSFLGFTNPVAIELAEKLISFFPEGTLSRVFFSDDGSTAMEAALKMCIQYWQLRGEAERMVFVAFDEAYHGDTMGAASLGGVPLFQERFARHHFPVRHLRSVEELEGLDGETARQVAAVVMEPVVQGVAGMRPWPVGMAARVRAWCDRTGAKLIYDEVMTGFGRTGTMFACQQESVFPDLMALAKGLTGGYLPLAATLASEEIYAAFLGEFEERKTFYYGHSYTGNALGCAAALASLEVFEEEGTLEMLPEKIAEMARLIAEKLKPLPWVGEIRQTGMIVGIQLQAQSGEPFDWKEQVGARVCVVARAHGLLTRPIGDLIVLMPPLCVSLESLELAVEALRVAIQEVCCG